VTALKVTDLGDYLKEQRQNAKLSLRQLAAQAGVSNPYLSQVERGLRKPSAEVLQQIAKGLRISAEALYVRAGMLEERRDRVEVEAAILTDPSLSERQRRVLLDIYETFRTENDRDAAGEQDSETSSTPADDAPTSTSAAAKTSTSKAAGSKTAAARKAPASKSAARRTAASKSSTTKKPRARSATSRTTSKRAAEGNPPSS
jgi:transcriptional regulator with XRE-family HTH domain